MQLHEIVDKYGKKVVRDTTNISEDAIDKLIDRDFSSFSRAKSLGLLSILEREYAEIDLDFLRDELEKYYKKLTPKEDLMHLNLAGKIQEEKSQPKWFLWGVLAILGFVTWYFFTEFDQRSLNSLISFKESNTTQTTPTTPSKNTTNKEDIAKELSIQNIVGNLKTEQPKPPTTTTATATAPNATPQTPVTPTETTSIGTPNTSQVEQEEATVVANTTETNTIKHVTIVPKKRLWFGIINVETGRKKHMSTSKEYIVDVHQKRWLISTSSAPFSLVVGAERQEYDNGKPHYFLLNGGTITPLNRQEYMSQGGYHRW